MTEAGFHHPNIYAAKAEADKALKDAAALQAALKAATDMLAQAQATMASLTQTADAHTATLAADNILLADLRRDLNAVPPQLTSYVSPTPMTVAQLLTSYPPSISTLGKYARVTDLFGAVDEVMRCRWDGVAYRWVPQRSDRAVVNTMTAGSLALTPLVTAPEIVLTGNLTGNITVTPSATNAWIGQRFQVKRTGLLGLFGINIGGLVGGLTKAITGGEGSMVYTAGGWYAV